MAKTSVVIIGGSTGSIDVLLKLLPALRPPLSFALVIILHRKNTSDSTLASLLSLKTSIPFWEVDDKDGTFSLDDSEKVNFSRPSIDVTFESAADVYGPSLLGMLLSGANADGTNGLKKWGASLLYKCLSLHKLPSCPSKPF